MTSHFGSNPPGAASVFAIEARVGRQATDAPSMGTAVVISLRQDGGDWKKYLLTCAHVVKSFSGQMPRTASGPIRGDILAFAPGKGYIRWRPGTDWPEQDGTGIFTGRVLDVYQRPADEWPEKACLPDRDWVLVDVDQASFQSFPAATLAPAGTKGELTIIGFPGGTGVFQTGDVVTPLASEGHRRQRAGSNPSVLKLDGGELVGPGMSGGGVFDSDGQLVGLYFGQHLAELSRQAIDAASIAESLRLRGYLSPPNQPRQGWVERTGWGRHSNLSLLAVPCLLVLAGGLSLVPALAPAWPSGLLLMLLVHVIVLGVGVLAEIPRVLRRMPSKISAACAVIGFLLSIAAFTFYTVQRQDRVHLRDSKWLTVGRDQRPESLTPEARMLVEHGIFGSNPTPEMLLGEFANDRRLIWTEESIRSTEIRLIGGWLVGWSALTVAIGAAIAALPQADERRKK